ncbi:MAG TPA: sigma factor [Gaiellaceae bacterium]
MRRYAWRRDPEIADDVAAETFVVAWRRLDQVPHEARPWLLGVARNVRLNLRRSQNRQASVIAALERTQRPTEAPDRSAAELSPTLQAALDALSPDDRELLLLHA